MSRRIDPIERISETFDGLDSMTQADIVAELFARLAEVPKQAALRRIDFHARMVGLLPREPRRRKEAAAPLLEASHAE